MRRFLVGTLAAGGVALALACGNQIDTSVTPGSSSSGGGLLPDGAPDPSADGEAQRDATTADQVAPVRCDAVWDQDVTADDDASTKGWNVVASTAADAGAFAPYDVDGVDGLRVSAAANSPTHLEQTLPPSCGNVTVKLRFQYLSNVAFTLLGVDLGPREAVTRHFSISFDEKARGFVVSRRDQAGGTGKTESMTIPAANGETQTFRFYVLNAVFARTGAVWAALDQVVDTVSSLPLLPASPSGEQDLRKFWVGVETSDDQSIVLDTIKLVPP